MTATAITHAERLGAASARFDWSGKKRYALLREAFADRGPVVITYRTHRGMPQTHVFLVTALGFWNGRETLCRLSVVGCRRQTSLSPRVRAMLRDLLHVCYLRPSREGAPP